MDIDKANKIAKTSTELMEEILDEIQNMTEDEFFEDYKRLEKICEGRVGRIVLPYHILGTTIPKRAKLNHLNHMISSDEVDYNRAFVTWGDYDEIVGAIITHVTISELDQIMYTVVFSETELGKRIENLVSNDPTKYEIELGKFTIDSDLLLSKIRLKEKK